MITYTWFRDALKEDTSKLFRTVGEMKILEKGRASGNSSTRNSNVAFFNNVEAKNIPITGARVSNPDALKKQLISLTGTEVVSEEKIVVTEEQLALLLKSLM